MGIILGKDRLYKEIEDNLFYAADNKTLSHAFIFEGPKESKKMEMAWGLSKKILKTEHLENCSDYFLIDNDKMNPTKVVSLFYQFPLIYKAFSSE